MPRPLDDDYPVVPADRVMPVTVAQMREVDRVMEQDLGIDLPRMMENAGRHLATLVRARFLGDGLPRRQIDVLAGAGGNGGGALAAARRLAGWGAPVRVWLAQPIERMRPAVRRQARILQRLTVPLQVGFPDAPGGAVVVDGIVGYGLRGPLRDPGAALVEWATGQSAPVVSLDVPSGLDSDTGVAPGAAMTATATLTLARPKTGLLARAARRWVGQLYLGDIGVPEDLYARLFGSRHDGSVFERGDLLRLVS